MKKWYQRFIDDNFITSLICTLIGTFVGALIALITMQYVQDKSDEKELQQIEIRAQKDMRQYLELLKKELEENNNLLQKNEKKYNTNILFFLEYHKSSFEMLKNSGAMRQIEDKTILSSIWRIYANLEELKQAHEYYLDHPNIGSAVQKQYGTIETRIDSMVIRLDLLLQGDISGGILQNKLY
jgi:uncharacterized membrane protein YgaE (UPF0421/DUF939 family)